LKTGSPSESWDIKKKNTYKKLTVKTKNLEGINVTLKKKWLSFENAREYTHSEFWQIKEKGQNLHVLSYELHLRVIIIEKGNFFFRRTLPNK
jgi:hypothetical protein